MVEVAGVEPASCRVSIQVATSLVGTWMFSPEVLATDLLIPEHHLKFYWRVGSPRQLSPVWMTSSSAFRANPAEHARVNQAAIAALAGV